MFRWTLALAIAAAPAFADTQTKAPAVKPLGEVWEVAYVTNEAGNEVKIGHIHFTSVEAMLDGKPVVRTTKELRFVIRRDRTESALESDVTTDESPEGDVREINSRIVLGRGVAQVTKCVIGPGPVVNIAAQGQAQFNRKFAWDPANIGLAREQTLLRDRSAKPGDSFKYKYFEPQITNSLTTKVEVFAAEIVPLPNKTKRELLKVVATPEPIKIDDKQTLQLPPATFWVDPSTRETVKTQMEIPGIGNVYLVRATKAAALAANGKAPDITAMQSIFLASPIPDMHERDVMSYRVTFKGKAKPVELVREDARQSIKDADGQTFRIDVKSVRKPAKTDMVESAGAEYTESNFYIDSDDVLVRDLAKRAAGTTADPWAKAQKIESFVRHYMKAVNYTEAMAPASNVAKTKTGDCTEFSMLTAAMCRAQGVPSRTAIGLVYVNDLQGKPALAFHMWVEVYIRGQWLAIDATLGQGSIGPGHIKITDHSWHKELGMKPLLPVQGFLMANPKIEVVK